MKEAESEKERNSMDNARSKKKQKQTLNQKTTKFIEKEKHKQI